MPIKDHTMSPLSLPQLYQSYQQLRAQLERQTLSYAQFVQAVRQLQAQDAEGRWWMIDPQTGHTLTYTANGWVEATPRTGQPAAQARQASSVTPARSAQDTAPSQKPNGLAGCLASPSITIILSLFAAGLWFAYSSLSPSSEGMDLMTPLIIAGVPILLRVFQKPLDRLLRPLYRALNVLPRPLLVGAAFAVPLVVGGIFNRSYGSGYQIIRRSTIVSVLFSYVLTRRPRRDR
jgi:hypothetical protein